MKRSRGEIVAQILDVCKAGANKTRIVYQTNLNFRTVDPYLETLIKNDLIEVRPGKYTSYETTQKGSNLLETISKANEEIKWR
jgi:predicted transcriptional regulator